MQTDYFKKFCLYYKGEESNPYESETDEHTFWYFEKVYTKRFSSIHTQWEEFAAENPDDCEEIAHFINDANTPIERKGFLCYMVADLYYHCSYPTFLEIVANYGKGVIQLPPKPWQIIKPCLYYNGEESNPFDKTDRRSAYWELERIWLKQVKNDDILSSEYLSNFIHDFPDCLSKVSKNTPTSLKAFMYDQYCHTGGSGQGFEAWLVNYFTSAS